MNKKFLIAPLGALSLLGGAVTADAQVVGDTGQSQTQNLTASQGLSQSQSSGDAVIGTDTETGTNGSAILGGNGEVVANAGPMVGDNHQSSAQTGGTSQAITQAGTTGTAENDSLTGFGSGQFLFFGGAIVGSPAQSATQSSGTSQAIAQEDGSGTNRSGTILGTAQLVLGTAIVGSPAQADSQAGTTSQDIAEIGSGDNEGGATSEVAENDSGTVLLSGQFVFGGPIVGSPAQSNAQAGATGQAIDQELGGDIIVGNDTQTGANNDATVAGHAGIIV